MKFSVCKMQNKEMLSFGYCFNYAVLTGTFRRPHELANRCVFWRTILQRGNSYDMLTRPDPGTPLPHLKTVT